jgi:N-acyl-L-homoserine lactone synthetase
MVCLVNSLNCSRHVALLQSMHQDRKRIFVDILKWDVPHDGAGEQDQFDDEHAEYLIVQDPLTGEHCASMRLLRTDRPHILDTLFSELCEREIPRDPAIREVTRLCMSPSLRARDRLAARNTLIRGMVEYAILTGIRAFTGVADMAWLSQILAAGWDCRPLGLPKPIGGAMLGGLIIHITPDTLNRFVGSWRCSSPALRVLELDEHNAA